MTDEPDVRLIALRRLRLGGKLFVPGQVIHVSGKGRVRASWGLCSTAQARPADDASRLDVELYGLLRRIGEPVEVAA